MKSVQTCARFFVKGKTIVVLCQNTENCSKAPPNVIMSDPVLCHCDEFDNNNGLASGFWKIFFWNKISRSDDLGGRRDPLIIWSPLLYVYSVVRFGTDLGITVCDFASRLWDVRDDDLKVWTLCIEMDHHHLKRCFTIFQENVTIKCNVFQLLAICQKRRLAYYSYL